MKRRTYISSLIPVPIILSGCLDSVSSSMGLAQITLLNASESETNFEINVWRNDETILSDNSKLSTWEDRHFHHEDMGKPVPYEVSVETADGRSQKFNSNQPGDNTNGSDDNVCLDVIFQIDDESISVFTRQVGCSGTGNEI